MKKRPQCTCGSNRVKRETTRERTAFTCLECDRTWSEKSPFALMREEADRGWAEGQAERSRVKAQLNRARITPIEDL